MTFDHKQDYLLELEADELLAYIENLQATANRERLMIRKGVGSERKLNQVVRLLKEAQRFQQQSA